MMRRRLFVVAAGLWGAAHSTAAQPAARVYRIGILASQLTTAEMAGPRTLSPPINALLSGLRELCIDNVQPQLRVLFGLDFPAQRLLAIWGEPLERRYYGDSVRHAEQRWRQYCDRSSTQRTVTP